MKNSRPTLSPQQVKQRREFAVKVGCLVREAREQKGYSQEKLADLAGYYRTYVGFIETGSRSPSAHTLWRLATALGLTLSELLQGLDSNR